MLEPLDYRESASATTRLDTGLAPSVVEGTSRTTSASLGSPATSASAPLIELCEQPQLVGRLVEGCCWSIEVEYGIQDGLPLQ